MSACAEERMKNCTVNVEGIFKLRTCFVKIKKCSNLPLLSPKNSKLSKEEKIILLPHKKSTDKKPASVKKGKVSKNKKDKKFQLKITSFYASPKQKTDRSTPDSGIASRSESPDSDQLSNDDDTEENNDNFDDTGIKNDFLKSLDEDTGDNSDDGIESDKDSSESEDEGSDWDEHGSSFPAFKAKPKKKAPKNAVHQPIKFDKTEKSEYEHERDKKIQEKDKLLEALKAQWNNFKAVTSKPKPTNRRTYTITREDGTVELRRSNRSIGEKPEYGNGLSDEWRPPSQKRARHDYFDEGNYKPVQREGGRGNGQGRKLNDPNVDVLMPEDITDVMLKNIHYYGKKIYSTETGTCCHQCRQKTTDQKTICRSGVCVGLKGQFCGTCLENRYGETVAEALKDADWSCPPCRKICNCSFCLETPTGQLYYRARAKGFKSVHHYLAHLRAKWDEETGEAKEDVEDDSE